MKQFKFGETYKINEVKNHVESDPDLFADLSKVNQAQIRSESLMDDVVANFHLSGDKARCIFNIYNSEENRGIRKIQSRGREA
ncbi:hypothetical protein IMZ31_24065 (plasmid) [Pontibacillus sp. ALD_SL1]|uniref:hypothetical protein n=1 Tax=Pontibacillus sp. ALD_SL1 TaxID=2777185 RepID=UPI001A96C69E|nr:hypothetical protein [Pontibacillus sp. ALD_SL1]QST02529.1 hypothetical protein IMZ31_24065 [Pontibacillus sp. ALD_SL1]